MGTVYRAEQASPRRIVALKVLRKTTDPRRLEEFRREAALIARLEHPGIVPLYGYGEHGGSPYLVLRFLGGGTVAERIRRGPIPIALSVQWAGQAADALEFAHQQAVVHRDVKPSNLLLDERDRAYLSDFGIAGTLADPSTDRPTGSAAYMAPEQSGGQPPSARSDVYSLAVSLFEMLTGQKPYAAETALGVMVRHQNDPVPSARALRPDVSAALDDLVQWGMSKDAAARPRSAAEFERLLRRAAARPESLLRPAAAGTLPAAPAPQRRISPLVWAGVAVLGLCGVGVALLGGGAMGALLAIPAHATGTSTLPTVVSARPTQTPSFLLSDGFSDSESGFPEAAGEDGGIAYVDGQLGITGLTPGWVWLAPSGHVDEQDVEIRVTVRASREPPRHQFGLACRVVDGENYVGLALDNEGSVLIWVMRQGVESRLLDWRPPRPLGPGDLDLIGVCRGNRLELHVNGTVWEEAEDPAPAAGDVALLAGVLDPGSAVVFFDELFVTP